MDGLAVDRFPVIGALIIRKGIKEGFAEGSVRVELRSDGRAHC